MKRIIQLTEKLPEEELEYAFSEGVKVQGGVKKECGNVLFIESGGRYKLFTQSSDFIRFLEGNGHFKWARGEVNFSAGDLFHVEEAGEYEVNGKCVFTVYRR